MNENTQPLFWDAGYEIVLALQAQHPDVDLEELSLTNLFDWIIQLPNFQDDPALATDEILMAIYQEWYEERNPL
ncbi:MAG: Fe-S cluster assembly protein IscX [Chloroflexi bacterium]|nr:Fe-S cluster assembly protein IscX [Chloroflexota bacterium]